MHAIELKGCECATCKSTGGMYKEYRIGWSKPSHHSRTDNRPMETGQWKFTKL